LFSEQPAENNVRPKPMAMTRNKAAGVVTESSLVRHRFSKTSRNLDGPIEPKSTACAVPIVSRSRIPSLPLVFHDYSLSLTMYFGSRGTSR
jgi:hypothetical protein